MEGKHKKKQMTTLLLLLSAAYTFYRVIRCVYMLQNKIFSPIVNIEHGGDTIPVHLYRV